MKIGVMAAFMQVSIRWMVTVLQLGAVVFPTLALYRHYRLRVFDVAALRFPAPLPLFGLLVFLTGLVVVQDTLMNLVMEVAPDFLAESFRQLLLAQAQIMDVQTKAQFVWYLVIVVFGAGVFEELLFRGLILRACTQHLPAVPTIILNGIFFGIMHQSVIGFSYYFVLGAVLAYVALRTGTLIYGIVLHCLLNLSAMILALKYGVLMKLPIPSLLAILGGLAAVGLGLALFAATESSRRNRPAPIAPDDKA